MNLSLGSDAGAVCERGGSSSDARGEAARREGAGHEVARGVFDVRCGVRRTCEWRRWERSAKKHFKTGPFKRAKQDTWRFAFTRRETRRETGARLDVFPRWSSEECENFSTPKTRNTAKND